MIMKIIIVFSLATSVIKTYLQDLTWRTLHRNEPLPIITLPIVKGLYSINLRCVFSLLCHLIQRFGVQLFFMGRSCYYRKKINEVGRHNYLKNINLAIIIV